jgi:hypothetical protein
MSQNKNFHGFTFQNSLCMFRGKWYIMILQEKIDAKHSRASKQEMQQMTMN